MQVEADGLQQNQRGGPFVEFALHPKQNMEKSVQAGRPIFEDVEYVKIIVPGDRDEVHRPARESDRRQFQQQYAAFKAGKEAPVTGTPLTAWPSLTASQVAELAFFNVKTVEQLADLPDAHAQKFMGIQAIKQKAKAFLEAAAGNAPLEKAMAAIEERDNVIETMQRQLKEQGDRIEQLAKKK